MAAAPLAPDTCYRIGPIVTTRGQPGQQGQQRQQRQQRQQGGFRKNSTQ